MGTYFYAMDGLSAPLQFAKGARARFFSTLLPASRRAVTFLLPLRVERSYLQEFEELLQEQCRQCINTPKGRTLVSTVYLR